MSDDVTILERPSLDAPTLLVMLAGWIDASGAAAMAMAHIDAVCAARTIATFDPDVFIDYRARRPVLELHEGVAGELIWPAIELKAGRDAAGRDVLLLSGNEPDANWRRFADLVTTLGVALGATRMIGLGAYPFAAPHTRPSRISCTTPSVDLARSVPYLRNSVAVPAGVEAVLERSFHDRGVPAIGLWVQVPHYISAMAHPGAAAALIDAVADTGGLSIPADELRNDAARLRARLDELIASNAEHMAMVAQLEAAYDSVAPLIAGGLTNGLDAAALPTGDELAAELERFLREQDG